MTSRPPTPDASMSSCDRVPAMLEALDPLARELVADYLDLVDARLPGAIQGLYLVGSIALNDFRPGSGAQLRRPGRDVQADPPAAGCGLAW